MSSLSDSSALSASESTSEFSESAIFRKSEKSTATTWLHYWSSHDDKSTKKDSFNIFYSKYCENLSWSCQSIISVWYHLLKWHSIELEVKKCQIKSTSDKWLHDLYMKADVQWKELKKKILKKMLDKQLINETLVSLIVLWNLSFQAVEWPELHTLLKTVNSMTDQEIISSHSKINKKIHISWIASQNIVYKKLQSALSKIHLSLDVWISLNEILFLDICTHFVNHDSQQFLKTFIRFCSLSTHSEDY